MSTVATPKSTGGSARKVFDTGHFCRIWFYVVGAGMLAWLTLLAANAL